MPTYLLLLYMTFGILASIVLPILSVTVQEITKPQIEHSTWQARLRRLWKKSKKYVLIGLFSLLTATILLALYQNTLDPNDTVGLIDTWNEAVIYGYMYDSTMQKFRGF